MMKGKPFTFSRAFNYVPALSTTAVIPRIFSAPFWRTPIAIIQRQVQELNSNTGDRQFYSTKDPKQTSFTTKETARDLDNVITNYEQLIAAAKGRMADIDGDTLGRLQRIEARGFNSWVPHTITNIDIVMTLHKTLVMAKQSRDFLFDRNQLFSDIKGNLRLFQQWTNVLVNDGFSEAQQLYDDIEKNVRKNQMAFAAGYVNQLYEHMKQRAAYTLVAIEPKYGKVKASTQHHCRADSKTRVSYSQDTPEHYYSVSEEKHETTLTDFKIGYKKENDVKEAFWCAFDQYAGVAKDEEMQYGGVDNTESTPPVVDYQYGSALKCRIEHDKRVRRTQNLSRVV